MRSLSGFRNGVVEAHREVGRLEDLLIWGLFVASFTRLILIIILAPFDFRLDANLIWQEISIINDMLLVHLEQSALLILQVLKEFLRVV